MAYGHWPAANSHRLATISCNGQIASGQTDGGERTDGQTGRQLDGQTTIWPDRQIDCQWPDGQIASGPDSQTARRPVAQRGQMASGQMAHGPIASGRQMARLASGQRPVARLPAARLPSARRPGRHADGQTAKRAMARWPDRHTTRQHAASRQRPAARLPMASSQAGTTKLKKARSSNSTAGVRFKALWARRALGLPWP